MQLGKTLAALLFFCATAVVGQTAGDHARLYSTGVGGKLLDSCTSADGVLVASSGPRITKFDRTGRVIWSRRLVTFNGASSIRLDETRDGNVVVAGQLHKGTEGRFDFVIGQLDRNGDPRWFRTFRARSVDIFGDARALPDGGCVFAVNTGKGALLANFSADGTLRRVDQYGGQSTNILAIEVLPDGYMFGGDFDGHTSWAARTGRNGDIVWQRSWGIRKPEKKTGFQRDTATSISAVVSLPQGRFSVAGFAANDAWIAVLGPDGSLAWEKTLGGDLEERFTALAGAADGGVIAAGTTTSFGAGGTDLWIVSFDAKGTVIDQQAFGGSRNDGVLDHDRAGVALDVFGQDDLVLAASTASFGERELSRVVLLPIRGGKAPACVDSLRTVAGAGAQLAAIETGEELRVSVDLEVDDIPVEATAEPSTTGSDVCFKTTQTATRTPLPSALPAVKGNSGVKVTAGEWFESAKQVDGLFARGEFATLDAMETRIREKNERTSHGWPRLRDFYDALIAAEISLKKGRQEAIDLARRWAAQRPASAVPHLILANAYLNIGWDARGGGFSDTVLPSGWKKLEEYGTRAHEELAIARKLSPSNPVVFDYLIRLDGAVGGGDMDEALRQGMAADPSYFEMYATRLNFLRPQWGGRPGDASRLAEQCATATKKKLGDEVYGRMALFWYRNYGTKAFRVEGFNWDRTKAAWRDILRKYPHSSRNTHMFLEMSFLVGDREMARELLKLPEAAWSPDAVSVWKNSDVYEKARIWAAANVPPVPKAEAPKHTGWVTQPPAKWPLLVSSAKMQLMSGNESKPGTAFLLKTGEKTAAVTTADTMSSYPMVQKTSLDTQKDVKTLKLDGIGADIIASGLISSTKPTANIPVAPQGFAFEVKRTGPAKLTPVEPRKAPLGWNEPVYLVACERVTSPCAQRVVRAVYNRDAMSVYGHAAIQLVGADLGDFESLLGALVLDTNGYAVAVVSQKPIPPNIPCEDLGFVFGWTAGAGRNPAGVR